MRRGYTAVLWAIVGIAFVLRLLGAYFGHLMFDESAHLALAESISFDPDRLHLIARSLDHPVLSIYVLKLSEWIFGDSNPGLRMLHVMAGVATVAVIFHIGRRMGSDRIGVFAAVLLAVDQFHASWSGFFMPEVVMLFFWALALLQMTTLLAVPSSRGFALLGLWMGLAYLGKETGVLLLPVIWMTTAVCRPEWFRRWAWYLAHAVMVLVISPDVIWNLTNFTEGYFHRHVALLSGPFALQLKSVSLFLGELIRVVIGLHTLDVDYADGHVRAAHWPAGVIYLVAVAWFAVTMTRSLRNARSVPDPAVATRWLLVIGFFVPFVMFLLVPAGERFDPYWWASPSLLSGVLLAGGLLDRLVSWHPSVRWVVAGLLLYLGAHFVPVAMQRGTAYPRVTVAQLSTDVLLLARAATERGDLQIARRQVIYVLNLTGPHPAAYEELARLEIQEGNSDAARAALDRVDQLSPGHQGAQAIRTLLNLKGAGS